MNPDLHRLEEEVLRLRADVLNLSALLADYFGGKITPEDQAKLDHVLARMRKQARRLKAIDDQTNPCH